jgi:hypothetical protein
MLKGITHIYLSIHSILVGTYIYLFIFLSQSQISDPARSIGVDGWGVMCLIVGNPVWVCV